MTNKVSQDIMPLAVVRYYNYMHCGSFQKEFQKLRFAIVLNHAPDKPNDCH